MENQEKIICQICGRACKNHLSLATHVKRAHAMISKEYYNLYFKKNKEEGVCKTCGKPTSYLKENNVDPLTHFNQ